MFEEIIGDIIDLPARMLGVDVGDNTIAVTCSHCGKRFYMKEWQSKSCPNCGRVTVGPKAKYY